MLGPYRLSANCVLSIVINKRILYCAVDYGCTSHHPHRVVDSVRLQMLLVGTCRQCGSWSDAGHNHRKVIGRDPICTSLQDMETVRQRPCTTRETETWPSDSRVGYNSVVNHKSQRPVLPSLRKLNCVDGSNQVAAKNVFL